MASFGVAVRGQGTTVEEMLAGADRRLRLAKGGPDEVERGGPRSFEQTPPPPEPPG